MQWTKYVGIPYLEKGRDTAGIDCWGLARLVYAEEFGITLPSFTEEYEHEDTDSIEKLVNINKEHWVKVEEPKPGHLILFRILGQESHVGIYLGQNKFLHAREGYTSAIERVDSVSWKNRVVGYFEYSEKKLGATLTAMPNPLKTETIVVPVPEGTTVKALSEWVAKEYGAAEKLLDKIAILINGKVVPKEAYSDTVIKDGDILQYRAVPGKDALRLVLVVAVMVVAPQIGAYMATTFGGTAAVWTAVVSTVGMLLVNAIAPIRPPSEPADPGSPARQLLMSGGANQANKYGAIPVVLGRVRMTAMLGAKSYVESSDENSDLNMLLVWGFGPLMISDLNIGATSVDQYENGIGRPVQYAHLNDTLYGDPWSDVALFNSIYAGDLEQNYHGIKLVNNPTDGEPWTESTLVEPDIIRLGVTFNFPQGLRHLVIKGKSAGAIYPKECLIELQYRALDQSGNPLYDWVPSTYFNKGVYAFRIPVGVVTTTDYNWYNDYGYTQTTNYYRWTRIAIDRSGNWVTKTGSYLTNPYADPVPAVTQSRWWNYNYGQKDPNSTIGYVRLPQWTNDEIPVWDVCVYGNTISIVDSSARRSDYSYSGFGRDTSVSWSDYFGYTAVYGIVDGMFSTDVGYVPAFASFRTYAGSVSRNSTIISLGVSNYVKRKDPFTHTQYISVPPNPGGYQVRVRRRNSDVSEPDDTNRYMHDVQLQTVTGYTNRRPVNDPPKSRITQTAIRVRATDQLNGQIEGINALVQTICLDWNRYTQQWVYATTNNPASLFRYVLQHPANAQRISDADFASRVDVQALQDWHEYCQAETFQYNGTITQQKSLLEVLKDIAAAGRASPVTVDGKWSVVIDRPRVDVVQHFTPHNSWGFESSKRLPKHPDGLKVTFSNETRGFQEEEIIVYAAGKNESNSEVFEQISLPGITRPDLVVKHARWHFAQAKLRPELYTLNTDMEYIVATRGDRVKVMHDVTMWGLSSGRIKERVGTLALDLDEPVPMKAGVNYSIRIRTSTGGSVVRNIVPVAYDNYYSRITLTAATTAAEASPGDLFMFGEVNSESNDLVILAIEPFGNGNAKITLTDYSPQIYSINYLNSNFYVPDFVTKITRPPELLIHSVFVSPEIISVVSDETVLERISPGVFKYNIKIGFRHQPDLPARVTGTEVQIDYAEDTVDNWRTSGQVPLNMLSATFGDVIEGDIYKVRARYVADDGRTGPWSTIVQHTIVGRTNPPAAVTGLTKTFEAQSATFKLEWAANGEVDLKGYEVRTSNTGWGTDTGYVYRGSETSLRVPVPEANAVITYYVKAYDYSNIYSVTAVSIDTTIAPPSIPLNLNYTYAVQSITGTTAVIDWDTPATVGLPISYYEVKLIKPQGTNIVKTLTTEYLTLVDWASDASVEVVAVDTIGSRSTIASLTLPKAPPETPGVVTHTVKDTSIVLDWADSVAGSLPVAGYEIRSSDSGWGINSNYLARVTGSKATITDLTTGSITWYVRSYDTAGQYSVASRSYTMLVNIPNAPTNIVLELSDTNLSGAQAAIRWTAATTTTFAIKHYEVTLTKYPGPSTTVITVAGDSLSLPVDWKDNVNISIRTVDVMGYKSNAAVSSYNKLPPANVGVVTTTTIATGGVQLTWAAPTKGTLAIDGYEIRSENVNPGTPGYVYRGSTNSATIPTVTLGTNTWYVWAFDTDGHYSASPSVVTFNVTAPGAATGLSAIFNASSNTTSTCTLRWVPPSNSMYNINRYIATFSYTNPISSSVTVNRDTTDWEIPANWIGNGTLTIKVVDVLGNVSSEASLVVAKQLPNTPGACTVEASGTSLVIDWPDTAPTTLPVTLYELRSSDSNWGSAGYEWKGTSSNTRISLSTGTGPITWYLKSVDSDGRYCATARTISYTVSAPANPVTYPAEFADTSLTSATVSLYWDPVSTVFGVQGYEVSYDGIIELVNSTTITLPANWLGDRTFTIKTVDGLGNKSTGAQIVATQLPPASATNFRAQVIDNNVLLYWTLPDKTTLPISHVSLRKGETWETATIIGDKAGTFTSISELSGGSFTYWIAVVDTDGNKSAPISLTASVSQPPDFIFNAEYTSTFSGTKVNCAFDSEDNNAIVLPVNVVENFAQHFTSNSWDQPSDQIAAGYPVYIQPGTLSGYYEEVFDYGTVLGSSQITLSITGNVIYGNPNLSFIISTSTDGVTWSDFAGSAAVFAVNFRYVKIHIDVSQETSGDIYRISNINVRLDAKQKSDGGSVLASQLNTNGTIVNFAQEFIDVVSVTLSAQGTVPLNPVYDLKDEVITGTYSISGNVATIVAANHGLVAGQRVRLFITSGGGITGRYIINSVVNANTYTVNMVAPNTSGNVTTYPNSIRVYLFDQAGNRANGNVSWAVRGY